MRFCPECKAQYGPGDERCPKDGAPLLTLPEKEEAPLDRSGLQRLQPVEADNSRYTIISKIGQGGWGGVYRAYQHSTRREVALKVLRQEVAHEDLVRRRFHREAEAVSQLKHPNTVTIFDFGETPDGLLFIAMEYIDGVSLDQIIEQEETLPPARAAGIARQIALSLAEAHEKGIVHRDVKPHNIMLTAFDGGEDFVKVLDFGVAKLVAVESSLTTTGATFGTPEYMSPEQVQSKDIDQRSDLYALGIILYQMLAGAPPFSGQSAVTVALSHIRQRPPAIRARGDIPRPLLGLVKRLLSKDPRDRPQSAREVAAELEDIEARVAADDGRDGGLAFQKVAGVMTSSWLSVLTVFALVCMVIVVVVVFRGRLQEGALDPGAEVLEDVARSRPALRLSIPDVPQRLAPDVVERAPVAGRDVVALEDVPGEIVDVAIRDGGAGKARTAELVDRATEVVEEPGADVVGAAVVDVRGPGKLLDLVAPRPDGLPAEPPPDSTALPRLKTAQRILANVDGADVTVDGRTVCETPCLLHGVPGEERRLRVLKKGYLTVRRRFTFAPGAEPLYIELKKVSLSEKDGLKSAPGPAEEDGLR